MDNAQPAERPQGDGSTLFRAAKHYRDNGVPERIHFNTCRLTVLYENLTSDSKLYSTDLTDTGARTFFFTLKGNSSSMVNFLFKKRTIPSENLLNRARVNRPTFHRPISRHEAGSLLLGELPGMQL